MKPNPLPARRKSKRILQEETERLGKNGNTGKEEWYDIGRYPAGISGRRRRSCRQPAMAGTVPGNLSGSSTAGNGAEYQISYSGGTGVQPPDLTHTGSVCT